MATQDWAGASAGAGAMFALAVGSLVGVSGISVSAWANGAKLMSESRMAFFICLLGVRLFGMGGILTDFVGVRQPESMFVLCG